ncbi:hypothetical protein D3C75_1131360 [compost metagenome]
MTNQPGLQGDIACQPLLSRFFSGDQRDGLLHTGDLLHCRFNFAKLDAVSPDFHLKILTSEKLQTALRQITSLVARTIQTFSRTRVKDKPLLRLVLVPPVAPGKTDTANV